jgi:hypothetical protein
MTKTYQKPIRIAGKTIGIKIYVKTPRGAKAITPGILRQIK